MDIRTVEDVSNGTHCAPIPLGPHLGANSSSRVIGSGVRLSCDEGFSLFGSEVVTCLNNTLWSRFVPTCKEELANGSNILIIVLSAVASTVLLTVIAAAIYMICKGCGREKQHEKQREDDRKKDYERRMRNISLYFGTMPDNVGMPPLVSNNVEDVLTGRTQAFDAKTSSNAAMDSVDNEDQKDNSAGEF